jgi:hypothetical protein
VNTTNKLQPFGHRRGEKTSTRPIRFAQLAVPVPPLLRARRVVLDADLGDGHLGHVDKGVHPDFASDRRHVHGRRQLPGGRGHAEVDPPTAADKPLDVGRFESVSDHQLGTGGPQGSCPLVLAADHGANRKSAIEEQLGRDRPANAIFKARRQPAMIRPSILHCRVPDGQTILASR